MATSKLQQFTGEQLSLHLNGYPIIENSRPDWLTTPKGERLELDFLIEPLSVAVEVQGLQHVQYSPFFHQTKQAFYDQLRRDKAKKAICLHAGIDLYYVFGESDLPWLIDILYETKEELASKRAELTAFDFARRAKHKHPATGTQRYYLRNVASLRDSLLGREHSGKDISEGGYQKTLRHRLRRIRAIEKKHNVSVAEDVAQFVDCAESLAIGGIAIRAPGRRPRFPGTERTRRRGRTLRVKPFSEHLYLVWGGQDYHRVWMQVGQQICDCDNWHNSRGKVCSHIYAAMIYNARLLD